MEADREPMFVAASDPLIWEFHPDPSRATRPGFERFFDGALASGGALTVVDRASGQIIGTSRYYDWQPAEVEVAIGYTFLARSHWGGAANGEMKKLMLDHAFRRARRVWLHIGEQNLRSRRAAEKLGAIYSHSDTPALSSVPVVPHAYYYILRPD